MPIYEYECQSCGKRIEVLQKVSDPPLENCDCGEEGRLKKLVSAPAFQFKGEGWYVTDYARKDGKDAGKDSGKDAGKDSGKSSGKDSGEKSDSSGSETKTAKASETAGTKSERISSSTPSSSSSPST